jgi:hypothetical protein
MGKKNTHLVSGHEQQVESKKEILVLEQPWRGNYRESWSILEVYLGKYLELDIEETCLHV